MDREEAYANAAQSLKQQFLSPGMMSRNTLTEPQPSTIADEAGAALSVADGLHGLLDELEHRLFGPEPRAVGVEGSNAKQSERPALAYMVKGTRQRLDSAADRVSRILGRL